ncbi:hypothetical protein [Enterococcus faecium]|uniref:PTS sugar transporter subunit IIA n=1 Tax=Enterococcus faecium TaxID=1352 RepID=A0A3F3NNX9_ENTFC|nr:hypothetical protein [Enterococcus faecium]RBS32807.1 hypothetical protein EB12_01288 [Enterococcus faecium]
MLKEQLSGNTMFMDAIDSWQEAIRVSARPLIGKGIIEESYCMGNCYCIIHSNRVVPK